MKGYILILFVVFPSLLFSQDKEKLLRKAKSAYNEGDYKGASGFYGKLAKEFPDDETGYNGMGICNIAQKKYESAVSNFSKAIAVEKNNTSYYYRASAQLYAGKTVEAIADLDKGIELNIKDTLSDDLHALKSKAYIESGDYAGAKAAANKALEIDSLNVEALYNLGLLYSQSGNKQEALNYMLKAVEQESNSPDAQQSVGFLLSELGRHGESIRYFDRAIELQPKRPIPYNNRGYARLMLKDYNGALEDINHSIKLNNKNAYAFRNRALVYLFYKNTSSACEDLRKAESLGFTKDFGNEVKDLIEKNCK